MEMALPMNSQPAATVGGMIAPLSGQSPGLQRAYVTNGIREVSYNFFSLSQIHKPLDTV